MPSPSLHSPINCSIPHCLSRRRERLRSIRKLLRTLNPQFDPFLQLIHNSRPRPLTRPEQKNIPFLTQFGRTDFCISVSVYWSLTVTSRSKTILYFGWDGIIFSLSIQHPRTDLHLLARQMGTSIAMIEHHYSHLIRRMRADKRVSVVPNRR